MVVMITHNVTALNDTELYAQLGLKWQLSYYVHFTTQKNEPYPKIDGLLWVYVKLTISYLASSFIYSLTKNTSLACSQIIFILQDCTWALARSIQTCDEDYDCLHPSSSET